MQYIKIQELYNKLHLNFLLDNELTAFNKLLLLSSIKGLIFVLKSSAEYNTGSLIKGH